MFDLFRSRDKAVRALLTGMLVLVGFSMITYLIPGSGSGYGGDTGGDQTVVAEIGKEKLTAQEVSRQIRNMTQNGQMPAAMLSIYAPKIVDQMIDQRAMAFEADRLGIKVSAEETDNAIFDSLPPQLIKDGKIDGATLNSVLSQEGITLADLKSTTARSVLIGRLAQIVGQGVIVTPQEVEAEFRRKNEKVKLAYAVLTPAKFQAEAEPSDTEIRAYYDAHKSDFRIPEKKAFGIVILDPQKVAASIQPTDAQLMADYKSRQNDFQTPERVKARHLLLKSDASNDAQMKSKAEALLKQIQGGADFAKLAKDNSQDPGSGAQGGELGWLVRGQTVPEFDKALFTLKPGETSGLVKTMYGYHIMQIEAHEQAHLQSFDEVKGQVLGDYQKREAGKQMQTLADKTLAALRKDPTHPEKVAFDMGGLFIRSESARPGDPIPGVGTSKDFESATAPLRKGEVIAGPVVLPSGQVVLASVLDVAAAHQASPEEARPEARNKAQQEKLEKLLSSKATELVAKTKSMDGDLEKAAKSMGIEVKTSADVDRQGTIESVGSASSVPEAFTQPVGAVLGPVTVTGGRLIAKIVSKTPANTAELLIQTTSIREDLRQKKSRDRMQLFELGLRERLKADGKLKIHQDVVNRIVQTYATRS